MIKAEVIARIAHETNRVYFLSIGDSSQPPWEDAPQWQKDSAVSGVLFHLEQHSRGKRPSPSMSHEAWLEQKQREGWKYSSTKNPDTKEHPCFIPYDELSVEQKQKDYLFRAVVEAFVECQPAEAIGFEPKIGAIGGFIDRA